jgi:phosphoglycolate phosphatase
MISHLVRVTAATRSIYVGDTEGDRLAASAAAVDFAHVSYGFGRAEHATVVLESFPELVAWFERTAKPNNALE